MLLNPTHCTFNIQEFCHFHPRFCISFVFVLFNFTLVSSITDCRKAFRPLWTSWDLCIDPDQGSLRSVWGIVLMSGTLGLSTQKHYWVITCIQWRSRFYQLFPCSHVRGIQVWIYKEPSFLWPTYRAEQLRLRATTRTQPAQSQIRTEKGCVGHMWIRKHQNPQQLKVEARETHANFVKTSHTYTYQPKTHLQVQNLCPLFGQ